MTDPAYEALGDCCPCGAAVEHGMNRCRKCRARSRYRRRKAKRKPSAGSRGSRAGTAPARRRN
jgi:hypothetical protein